MTATRRRSRPLRDEHTPDLRVDTADLVVLVADKDMEQALTGLLGRPGALGVRTLKHQIFRHPQRDSGCFNGAADFLRAQSNRFAQALVMFDRQGCGREPQPREQIERMVEGRLAANGWNGRAAAVVLDPELEAWVWSASLLVDQALGWAGRSPTLRSALVSNSLLIDAAVKPSDPKRAVEWALQAVRKPRSSAVYYELARSLPIGACTDTAFRKFVEVLQRWFPPTAGPGAGRP